MKYIQSIMTASILVLLSACGSSGSNNANNTATSKPSENQTPENEPIVVESSTIKIKLNQLGYLPNAQKIAIVPNVNSASFSVISTTTAQVVFEGTLSNALTWSLAGNEQFKQADFSAFVQPGTYKLSVAGVEDSAEFEINADVYSSLHDAALKYYYFNRSSMALESTYAGEWARAAGHSDEQVKVHASGASTQRPALTVLPSAKGWYDAGDYGKYVVNSGISTYTLLAAYEHFSMFYQNRDLNIPESNNKIPDILDEALWNIEWLATMQDQDGSVYHKLTTLDWPGIEMPNIDTRERFFIGKSTAAALNFAAVLSMASRIYQPFEDEFPGKSAQWLTAAESAWRWAVENPNLAYQQPDDVNSGAYGDNHFDDEFAWAAAELFITTQQESYLTTYFEKSGAQSVPSWANVAYLGTSTLLLQGETYLNASDYQSVKTAQLALADSIISQYENNHYAVAIVASDFVWGSNGQVLNKAIVLLQAYRLSGDENYKAVALEHVNYVLGRNPTDYSFVTGYGDKPPMFPHHRISAADGIVAPIPGMLVGGPHSGRQDGCSYAHLEPARSYLDDWCSFSTNEVTINWNAPLVYVLGALLSE